MFTRRDLLGLGAAVPLLAQEKKLKVVVTGGHPDDPESGCGGTIAAYVQGGHSVTIVYLTRGEAGGGGKPADETARLRTREAEAACKILGARPVFAGQIDGATEVNAERYESFRKILAAEEPDVLFTHWPVDRHRDHRAASLLTDDYCRTLKVKPGFYYYEEMTGYQTQNFLPTDYVDITATEGRKRDACFAHASQGPADFYRHHTKMNEFRGIEARARYAEGFVRHTGAPVGRLP